MKTLKSITVYLGSGGKVDDHYRENVKDFALNAVQQNIHIVYGGMNAGTMGILADTVLEENGDITGVVPTNIKDFTTLHEGLQKQEKLILTDDMWERKKEMVSRGQAAIIFPGGYGTLDELFEFLYWGTAGYHNKPCVLMNSNGYWDPIIAYIKSAVEAGLIGRRMLDMIISVTDNTKNFTTLDAWLTKNHNPEYDENIFTEGNDFLSRIELSNLQDTDHPIVISKPNTESTYRLANALVLKQLNKIKRPIGVLDKDPTMCHIQDWIKIAAQEKFITPNCPDLVVFEDNKDRLNDRLSRHVHISSDLHEKWEAKDKG